MSVVDRRRDAQHHAAAIRLRRGQSWAERLRQRTHLILDHPRDASGFLYHIGVFCLLLVVVLLDGLPSDAPLLLFIGERILSRSSHDSELLLSRLRFVSHGLTLFLLLEFFVRLWAAGADERYKGNKGRLRYALLPLPLLDIVVASLATLLFLDVLPPEATDLLRPWLLLRALHWDRHVQVRVLVAKIIRRCWKPMFAIFYIALIAVTAHAFLIYQCELSFGPQGYQENKTSSDIKDFGDGMWFSLVTGLSIGYGDLVPKAGFCRLITIANGYPTIILLFSLQTLVAVGITEQVKDLEITRREAKIRFYSASLIQSWYRFHLLQRSTKSAGHARNFKETCRKMWQAKMKMERMRSEEKDYQQMTIGETVGRLLFKQLRKAKHMGGNNTFVKRGSLPGLPSDLSSLMPGIPSRSNQKPTRKLGRFVIQRSPSLEMLQKSKSLEEESKANDVIIKIEDVDCDQKEEVANHKKLPTTPAENSKEPKEEMLVKEFGPLVSFIHFMLFRYFIRKLRLLRISVDEEKAMRELAEGEENGRRQLRQLENTVETMLRPFGALSHPSIASRMDQIDNEMASLTEKVDQLAEMAEAILALSQGNRSVRELHDERTSDVKDMISF